MDAGKDGGGSDHPRAATAARGRSSGTVASAKRARKPDSATDPSADRFRRQAENEYGHQWRPGALAKLLAGAADSMERTASLMEEMVASRAATIDNLNEVGHRIDQRQNEIDAMLAELVRGGARR